LGRPDLNSTEIELPGVEHGNRAFIFDRMTPLDAVGPLEVIGRVPDA
jgi:hypothetical protein